jgi:2-keto-4-pentenoate hydratase/2-oxohepta-3-ene-1,7-dioic acid hydratase in catechol pathway
MRTVRFRTNGETRTGTIEDDQIKAANGSYDRSEVKLLPPCDPNKVIAVGKNYSGHVKAILGEVQRDEFPMLFFKPLSSMIADNQDIVYPETTEFVDYEAELGVVIGTECSSVSEGDATEYIKGYTCVNDVTARDWQQREEQWSRAKGLDTFCPVGPCIQTDVEDSLDIECRVNGEVRQSSNTENLLFSIPELVAEVSQFFTLAPGDIIATGTPAGTSAETVPMDEWDQRSATGALQPGDTVEVEIETIGTLANDVVHSSDAGADV